MSKLCLTLTDKTIKENLKVISNHIGQVDLIELRVDFLELSEQKRLHEFKCDIPVILTFRKKIDGGLYSDDEDYRLLILLEGIQSGNFKYVDLEDDLDAPQLDNAAISAGLKIIRSFHDFKGVPSELGKKLMSVKRSENEIPKAAVMINSTKELLEFYTEAFSIIGEEKIILGMGNFGFNTRVLAEKVGSYLTFCSKEGTSGAPGHVSPKVLNSVYRFKNITKNTQIMGIIGNPVMHTKSPVIHNRGYETLGLNAVYVPFETDDPEMFLKIAELLNLQGFSVTVPFKNDIIPLLNSVSQGVEMIGACNTVTRVDNLWVGENTDYIGFINPLKTSYGDLEGKKVTVIGAGGAAKAALFALKAENAKVLVINRTVEKAKELAKQFSVSYSALSSENIELIREYSDVIIQTTNAGMHPLEHIDPLSFYGFGGKEFLYDIIYIPEKTLFLEKGASSGCSILNGWQMLLEQGYRQFKLFTGKNYPLD